VNATLRRSSRFVAALAAIAVGGVTVGHAQGTPETSETDRNVALLGDARARTREHGYAGEVVVRWTDAKGVERTGRTYVHQYKGVAEIGDERVMLDDDHHLVFNGASWSTATTGEDLPRADDKYDVVRRAGAEMDGRPVTVFTVTRDHDRALVERFWIDDATGAVLRRDSYDGGTRRRSSEFTTLDAPAEPTELPGEVATHDEYEGEPWPRTASDVELPYRDPVRAGDGFRLVGRWKHRQSVVQLAYSDGVLSASVFEQPGRLDWDALPASGEPAHVDGRPAVAYSLPFGDAVVWERAGVVYTCVGDAPRGELLALAAGVSRRGRDDALTRLARVVLAPFRW
jgi:sigma-E factor negative regulatory protein RseB